MKDLKNYWKTFEDRITSPISLHYIAHADCQCDLPLLGLYQHEIAYLLQIRNEREKPASFPGDRMRFPGSRIFSCFFP